MSDENVVSVLLRKRGELLAQVQGIQSAIYHVDQTLALIGYHGEGQIMGRERRFANGELIALVGEAERAGHRSPPAIAQYVMGAKGMDLTDKKLAARILWSVKDCRKRLAARGA